MSEQERELSTHVLEEAGQRGETLLIDDLIELVARYDDDGRDGVRVDRLVAYAERLAEGGHPVDPDSIRPAVDDRLVDDTTWVGEDALYATGEGRVSLFPQSWYDELAGERDVRRYVEVLTTAIADSDAGLQRGGAGEQKAGDGVPQSFLIDVAAVVGGLDREAVRGEVEQLRVEGVLAEDADQHPDGNVRLAEDAR
ncbi:hypothetical protein C2R22_04075 [Salinigranum rubrum]|uniref:Uncharacterized protein n=1 Tax=Salinigranum rubrum TaxID=755307 RepID=A0A2I8VG90_9EURY|nr:hypothetical protein [Salinigranum rubrum]AUV80938.1 hypothetical protein C2R22_04075 [Salinigranum rubrum]